MRSHIQLAALMAVAQLSGHGQAICQPLQGCDSLARAVVSYLAHDSLGGRPPASRFDTLAARYIAQQFASLGLRPYGMGGQYIQPFTFADTALGSAVATFNVVGWLPRGKPTTWVIGAHYDHLGQGGSHSHEVGRTGIHNGADDNASGVALLLLLAQYVQQHPNLPCNFLFVAFGGHEPGLYGSAHFVRTFSDSLPRWGGMLNFDMVGRLDARTHTVGVAGLAIANPCHNRLRTGAEALGLRLRDRMDWITGSDHAAFYQAGVPVLAFTTGRHTDYHRMTDDAHRLNYPGICILQQWLSTWLAGN